MALNLSHSAPIMAVAVPSPSVVSLRFHLDWSAGFRLCEGRDHSSLSVVTIDILTVRVYFKFTLQKLGLKKKKKRAFTVRSRSIPPKKFSVRSSGFVLTRIRQSSISGYTGETSADLMITGSPLLSAHLSREGKWTNMWEIQAQSLTFLERANITAQTATIMQRYSNLFIPVYWESLKIIGPWNETNLLLLIS